MSTINVNCVDQVLSFTNMPVIASGDVGADKIKFTFSENWDGLFKLCVFYQQKGSYFYGVIDDQDEVVIPSGVLNRAGNVYFGVSGHRASDENQDSMTLTSTVLSYEIREGAYNASESAETGNLLHLIGEMKDTYDRVVNNLAYLSIDGDNEFEYPEYPSPRVTAIEGDLLNLKTQAVKIVTGTWEGDELRVAPGTDRWALSFPVMPKLVILNNGINLTPIIQGGIDGRWRQIHGTNYTHYEYTSYYWNGTTLLWEPDPNSDVNDCECFNKSNVTYSYLAFMGVTDDAD